MDVAIVGVGLHPFGRFAGVTGIEMGAIAIRSALADAGVAVARHPVRVRAGATRSTTPTRWSR